MSACELEGGHPALNTYFELGERGQQRFTPLDVLRPRFFGQADGPGGCLMFINFREDRAHFADIASDVGVDPFLRGLQLGSARIEGDHSGSRWCLCSQSGCGCVWERAGETGSLLYDTMAYLNQAKNQSPLCCVSSRSFSERRLGSFDQSVTAMTDT